MLSLKKKSYLIYTTWHLDALGFVSVTKGTYSRALYKEIIWCYLKWKPFSDKNQKGLMCTSEERGTCQDLMLLQNQILLSENAKINV